MKKCPKCSSSFGDDMSFCLQDGTSLISEATQDLPATVTFNQHSPQTQRIDPPPTVFASVPQQSYQPSQFGQQPPFGQQTFGMPVSAPPAGNFGLGRIVVVILLLFIGFMGIVGVVAGVFMFSRSTSTRSASNTSTNSNLSFSNSATPNNNGVSNNNSKATNSQDTEQAEIKNGFKRIAFEDVTARGFFPGANKTSAATFESGSSRVVSFASAYDSTTAAQSAFQQRITDAKNDGSTVTQKMNNYAYYNKRGSYSVDLYVENKLYEYSTNNQQVLYKFAK